MSIINTVESAIVSLDGGKYQKLMDAYLMRKYQFSNIHPLGVQTGTGKPTKGTPDSYVECNNGQYIIIMYGSVETASFLKLKSDILSCFNTSKLSIPVEKIDRIICAYTSTNLHIEQIETLKNLIEGVKIELIGLGTVAHDIVLKYRFLAARFLNIPVNSGRVLIEGDTDKLLKLYVISMESNRFDYKGSLLIRLIQIDITYWSEITKKCGGVRECNTDSRIFDKIWIMDNYHELIDIAYTNMRDSYFCYLRHDTIIHMFASSEKNKPLIMERKELWIREHIDKYAYDESKIKDIFDVIATVFPEKRLEYVKELLKKNSSFDMFKKIFLFPSSRSWSGSEVPLIEKDIEFLQKLLDEISGVDYLEHRLYLKEWISEKSNISKRF